jgi:hypothetical protein
VSDTPQGVWVLDADGTPIQTTSDVAQSMGLQTVPAPDSAAAPSGGLNLAGPPTVSPQLPGAQPFTGADAAKGSVLPAGNLTVPSFQGPTAGQQDFIASQNAALANIPPDMQDPPPPAPLPNPKTAAPAAPAASPAAPPPPRAPPTAPPGLVLPTGGGGGGGGVSKQVAGLQAQSDKAYADQAAATQAQGQANADAAAPVRAMAEQGVAQAQIEDQNAQAARQVYQQQRDGRLQAYQQLLNQDRQQTIDPNHFWASRDTAHHVMATLGTMFGSFGAALTHGPNVAQQIIDKAVDQDYQAQKDNIANQRENTAAQGNFVNSANAAGLSDVEAMEMHKIRSLETIQHSVDLLKNTATGPQAAAAGQLAGTTIQNELAKSHQNLAQFSSNLATQQAQRYHMSLENQQLAQQTALQKYQMEHPELFHDQTEVAHINGQPVYTGKGGNGPALTQLTTQHQHAINLINQALQNTGSSYLPVGDTARLGEQEGNELRGAIAPLIADNPKLGARLSESFGGNIRSVYRNKDAELRELKNNLKENWAQKAQNFSGWSPAQAKAYSDTLWNEQQ